MRQPLVAPTSMYSMKRSTMPVPLKCRAIGRISCSLVPRLTTMLILTGPRPAARAASMPLSTSATGKSTSFMRRNTASSSPSRLTVTRCSPASFNALALRASSEPLVVSVRSSGAPSTVAQAGQLPDQELDVLAQQRFAAGEADLAHPMRHELPRHAGDFLERQQGRMRQVGVVLVEHLLGHAVAAAEVAAVGHADAQVAQRPPQRVRQRSGGRYRALGHARGQRGKALVDQGNDAFGHDLLSLGPGPARAGSHRVPTGLRPPGRQPGAAPRRAVG